MHIMFKNILTSKLGCSEFTSLIANNSAAFDSNGHADVFVLWYNTKWDAIKPCIVC